ncbi:hypothetical protein MHYMCMPASI_00539 [Hyalomma marginatum]|uniref:Uncharacterized protein n=1 Tax=Hyalomma marginatum TaxID=34627 RepID=A0A8S4C4R2_9ACAR|nr:hypothetical protein MHYMCMPASI_00539 [Hyalomma marginatum]
MYACPASLLPLGSARYALIIKSLMPSPLVSPADDTEYPASSPTVVPLMIKPLI